MFFAKNTIQRSPNGEVSYLAVSLCISNKTSSYWFRNPHGYEIRPLVGPTPVWLNDNTNIQAKIQNLCQLCHPSQFLDFHCMFCHILPHFASFRAHICSLQMFTGPEQSPSLRPSPAPDVERKPLQLTTVRVRRSLAVSASSLYSHRQSESIRTYRN